MVTMMMRMTMMTMMNAHNDDYDDDDDNEHDDDDDGIPILHFFGVIAFKVRNRGCNNYFGTISIPHYIKV
jgi:hypothetical protein